MWVDLWKWAGSKKIFIFCVNTHHTASIFDKELNSKVVK
jgi:hypothetical protein